MKYRQGILQENNSFRLKILLFDSRSIEMEDSSSCDSCIYSSSISPRKSVSNLIQGYLRRVEHVFNKRQKGNSNLYLFQSSILFFPHQQTLKGLYKGSSLKIASQQGREQQTLWDFKVRYDAAQNGMSNKNPSIQ